MTDPSTPAAGLYIFSAPSGGGKTSLARALAKDCVDVSISISHTTRSRRSGEKDGQDYFFVNCATFKKMIEQGDFLEYARVFDDCGILLVDVEAGTVTEVSFEEPG